MFDEGTKVYRPFVTFNGDNGMWHMIQEGTATSISDGGVQLIRQGNTHFSRANDPGYHTDCPWTPDRMEALHGVRAAYARWIGSQQCKLDELDEQIQSVAFTEQVA